MQLRTLIFDLDNTLLPSDAGYQAALDSVLPGGLSEYIAARTQVKSLLPSGSTASHNRALYFKKIRESVEFFSAKKSLELLQSYDDALENYLRRESESMLWRRNILELGRTFKVGILTNENVRTQLLKLSVFDPDGIFCQKLLCSEELGVEKPNVLMFTTLLKTLSSRPEESAYIGDSIEADILPALELGFNKVFHTVEFSADQRPTPVGAIRLESLSELQSHLKMERA